MQLKDESFIVPCYSDKDLNLKEFLTNLLVPRGGVFLFWLGQAGFICKFDNGFTITIDPYLTDSVENQLGWKRLLSKILAPTEVPAGLILFTHEHYDHCDIDALAKWCFCPDYTLAGAPSCSKLLLEYRLPADRFISVLPGSTLVQGTVVVEAIATGHTDDSIGIILRNNMWCICHTGDTEATHQLVEKVRILCPDILILPINGKYGNMNAVEAAEVAAYSSARFVIPMHYGMFAENTVNPIKFMQTCCRLGIGNRVRILDAGGGIFFPPKVLLPRTEVQEVDD